VDPNAIGPWSLTWLAQAIATVSSEQFYALNLKLWYFPLLAEAVPAFDLGSIEEALLRTLVAPGQWNSEANLTFMQTRRIKGIDYDKFVQQVQKTMPTLDGQKRLSVLVDY
jgi:hypothetical protein